MTVFVDIKHPGTGQTGRVPERRLDTFLGKGWEIHVPSANDEPPRTGKGSGLGPWRAHAEELGIDLPEGTDRDDVIAIVDAHNDPDNTNNNTED